MQHPWDRVCKICT